MPIVLGSTVKSKSEGARGVATSRCEYLFGPVLVGVEVDRTTTRFFAETDLVAVSIPLDDGTAELFGPAEKGERDV